MRLTVIISISTALLWKTANCQELEGIGPIKIGRSITEVCKEIDSKNEVYEYKGKPSISAMRIKDWEKENKKMDEATIWKLLKWEDPYDLGIMYTNDDLPFMMIKYPGMEYYWVKKYSLSTLTLNDIFIGVKNGTVVFFRMNPNRELISALKEKYKPTHAAEVIDTIKCKYVYTGAKTQDLSWHDTTFWNGLKTRAEHVNSTEYGSDCKISKWVAYLRVYDNTFYFELQKYLAAVDNEQKENESKKKKELLDKL